jgi:hypothetical protein
MSDDELRARTERNMERFNIPKGTTCIECGGSGVWSRKDALYPCAVCDGSGVAEAVHAHHWRPTGSVMPGVRAFQCTRCGKREYVERAE